jgi:Ca2+-binding EF-hand superfamily protein
MIELTELTELQVLKLNRAFAHLDVDGDGQIEREDVLALGARLLIGFGEAPTSAKGQQLIETFDALWDALLAELELGSDGRLSTDELRDAMAAAFIEGSQADAVLRPAAEAVARLADGDGDGLVGLDELRTLHEAFGLDGDEAEEALDRLAIDGGRLTVAELAEAAVEFYTSADPEAVGNWLFGAVTR